MEAKPAKKISNLGTVSFSLIVAFMVLIILNISEYFISAIQYARETAIFTKKVIGEAI